MSLAFNFIFSSLELVPFLLGSSLSLSVNSFHKAQLHCLSSKRNLFMDVTRASGAVDATDKGKRAQDMDDQVNTKQTDVSVMSELANLC